jgi:hypothetical protein
MMNEFQNEINRTNSMQYTENGATGHSTTGNELVDLNFKVPSFRKGVPTNELLTFDVAMRKNLSYAIKWLFFLRDAREGLGEKRAFVEFFTKFFTFDKNTAIKVISLVGEYGRWKDIFDIIQYANNNELKSVCFNVVKEQLKQDVENLEASKSISLLAKWIPSINASDSARPMALELRKYLGLSNKEYRKMLSKLRAHIGIVESMTCANQWGDIDYEKVPSKANLRYKDAFLKHDGERRQEFLDAVLNTNSEDKPKINATVLYPHEIWSKYTRQDSSRWPIYDRLNLDKSLEALWQNLKDIKDCGNTMVVCDGSGSMESTISGSNVQAIDVSRSLSVYFAERCEGEFKNKFIEFSSTPHFIDINGCNTLLDKIKHVAKYTDCSNTDIEKVFMLLLNTAKKHQMKQSDLPDRILIVSDMEFDSATTVNRWSGNFQSRMNTIFDNITREYNAAGYKMPRLVFWNVNSRTNTIPVTENENGVALVSGFSVNIVRMVMSGKTDPWLVLKETLDSERYSLVDKALVDGE